MVPYDIVLSVDVTSGGSERHVINHGGLDDTAIPTYLYLFLHTMS